MSETEKQRQQAAVNYAAPPETAVDGAGFISGSAAEQGAYRPAIAAFKAALPYTLPVLAGFAFLGIAYGVLMTSIGCSALWVFLNCWLVFAGSMQYVALTLFVASFNPLYALFISLMVNARHLFYGLSMLDKFKDTGAFKPYLIFALCDETFAIISSTQPPPGIDRRWFMLWVAVLNRWYWILGSVTGAVLGGFIRFDTTGIDFALTALFVVILVNQWLEQKNHWPVVIGLSCSLVCLLVFGRDQFILAAMAAILVIFIAGGRRLDREVEQQ